MNKLHSVITHEAFALFLQTQSKDWRGQVFYKVDFSPFELSWHDIDCSEAAFIACIFPQEMPLGLFMQRGALILPKLPKTPYDPYHSGLYTPEELMSPRQGDFNNTLDGEIYHAYQAVKDLPLYLSHFLSQWIHDYALQVNLEQFLQLHTPEAKKVVAIMGGHSSLRTSPAYKQIAEIARALTREGFCLASGGGPGAMEATNLGAWLAPYPDEALQEALQHLSSAPAYQDTDYLKVAWELKARFPKGAESLSLPTWFYGHEPSNIFATHIAKYFSNSIREDGLLAIAHYGVIYTPGKAGTLQEIFMDATQNHYGVFEYVSPMIFLGKEFWQKTTGVIPVLDWLSEGLQYKELITVTDSTEEVISAIKAYQLTPYAP